MATLSNNDIARAIYGTLESKTRKDMPLAFKRVVSFLNKRRLLSKAPDILKKLEEIINLKEDRLMVKVLSSRKLDEKIREELKALLIKKYKSKEVVFTEKINEHLIGGVRLEIKDLQTGRDEVIDLTVKKQFTRLQEHLIKGQQ